ncbi:MAG: hypothetical protein ACRERD_04115 [Candidatus Binatia bacterium]
MPASARRSIAGLHNNAPSRGLKAGLSRRWTVARPLHGRAEAGAPGVRLCTNLVHPGLE